MVHPRDVGADLRRILKLEFFQPLAALLGLNQASTSSDPTPDALVSIIVIA